MRRKGERERVCVRARVVEDAACSREGVGEQQTAEPGSWSAMTMAVFSPACEGILGLAKRGSRLLMDDMDAACSGCFENGPLLSPLQGTIEPERPRPLDMYLPGKSCERLGPMEHGWKWMDGCYVASWPGPVYHRTALFFHGKLTEPRAGKRGMGKDG